MPVFESIGIHKNALAGILGKVSWKPEGREGELCRGLIEGKSDVSAFKEILEKDANIRSLVVSQSENPAGLLLTLDPHLLELVDVEAGMARGVAERSGMSRY